MQPMLHLHHHTASAARKLLQRVPPHRLLLPAASVAVVSSRQFSVRDTDDELLLLKQSGNKQLAKKHLKSLLSLGKATATHCKWALQHVSTGIQFDEGLLSAMKERNILIDEEAKALVKANRLLEKRKTQPNLNRQAQNDMSRLQFKLAKNGKAYARKAFKKMQKKKHANALHYGWAMKELCETSDEKRSLMKSMTEHGVVPIASNFNVLLNNLLHEGDIEAAQHVIDVDMPAAGVAPDNTTMKTMARSDKLAGMGRTSKLNNILKLQGAEAALQEFEEIQSSGCADAFQYGWAMKNLCKTSDESQALFESMKLNSVVPEVGNFTQLISNLLHNGDIDAAQHIYDVEMPAAGVEPDDGTNETMARADELASMGRTSKLQNLFDQQGKDAALQEFEKMQKDGHAGAIHYGWAMKNVCETSEETRATMASMKLHSVAPEVGNFHQLISNLLHGGDHEAAQHVIDVDMPAAGIEANDKTAEIIKRSGQLASMGRVTELKRLLQEGKDGPAKGHAASMAAREQFQAMLKKGGGNVDIYMCSYAMAYLCSHTNLQRELLTQLQELRHAQKITLSVSDVTQLVNQLMFLSKIEDKDDKDDKNGKVDNDNLDTKPSQILTSADAKSHAEEFVRLLAETDEQQAREYFDQVVKNKQATAFLYGLALTTLCKNSAEQREMLKTVPKKKVTMYAYNALVNQLQSEGKEEAAKKVLEVDMRAAGFEVNEASLKAMKEFTWKSW